MTAIRGSDPRLDSQNRKNPIADSNDKPEPTPNGSKTKLPPAQPRGYFEGESMTRRKVFVVGSQALGGLAGAAVLLPVVGFVVAPVLTKGEERWEAVGKVDDFDAETYRTVVFTETVGIGEAGKTTAYVRRGSTEFEGESPDQFVAISTRCAHLGCPVRFVQAAGNFICPCHGGVYDFIGKRIGGPPVRPLDRFQTRVRNGFVELGPRYSVTNQLKAVRTRDPGEFTGGIWEYLYPPRPTVLPPPSS